MGYSGSDSSYYSDSSGDHYTEVYTNSDGSMRVTGSDYHDGKETTYDHYVSSDGYAEDYSGK